MDLRYCPLTGDVTNDGQLVTMIDHGYFVIRADGNRYYVHRLIWELMYGEIPKGLEVDHINGLEADNRIVNLRVVTHRINMMNRVIPCNNSSGRIGVHYDSWSKRWRAEIYVLGKRTPLGRFAKFEDAVQVRREAEIKHGYHENHGRAA
tara:strand:+ start:569 stop:1015 length:447 start_codon:yes stop_codon:yes gene_type:complete